MFDTYYNIIFLKKYYGYRYNNEIVHDSFNCIGILIFRF